MNKFTVILKGVDDSLTDAELTDAELAAINAEVTNLIEANGIEDISNLIFHDMETNTNKEWPFILYGGNEPHTVFAERWWDED